MSETRAPYNVGNMRIHDAGEVFTVRIDYKVLDVATGKSEAKTFTCDALATDADTALIRALGELRHLPPTAPPLGKIWGVVADVSVQSDVLRDQLGGTF